MLSLINCSTKAAKVQADGEIGIVGQEGKLPCSIGRTALMVVSVLPCQMERPIRASNYAGAHQRVMRGSATNPRQWWTGNLENAVSSLGKPKEEAAGELLSHTTVAPVKGTSRPLGLEQSLGS